MSTFRRRSRGFLSQSLRKQRRRDRSRRVLQAEQLEGRMLLAADLELPFASNHNNFQPLDTNVNGWVENGDVLAVINQINREASGEHGGSDAKTDVNDDGHTTALDALRIINDLERQGASENGDVVAISGFGLSTDVVSTSQLAFEDNVSSNDTIVRSDGGSWLSDGFAAGDMILVSDSGEFFDVDIQLCSDFHAPNQCQLFNDPNDPNNPNNGQPIIGETTDDQGNTVPILGDFDPDRHRHNNGMFTIQSATDTTLTLTSDAELIDLPNDGFQGTPNVFQILDNVGANEPFLLGITAEDLRVMDDQGNSLQDFEKGPFAVYLDVNWDPSAVAPTSAFPSVNDVDFFNFLESQKKGNFAAGLANGLGGAGFSLPGFSPLGAGKHLVFTFEMAASQTTTPGNPLTITPSFEDVFLPERAVLLSGGSAGVPQNMIQFQPAQLDVVSDLIAVDDMFTVNEDSQNNNLNVLANDQVFNPQGAQPVITNVNTAGTQGTVNFTSSSLTFTPASGFTGNTSFTYTISNGSGGTSTDTATVDVTVTPVQDPPVVNVPGGQSINEDTTLSLPGVSVNDGDGDDLTVDLTVNNGILNLTQSGSLNIFTGNGSGTVQLAGTLTDLNNTLGSLSYLPNLDFNGSDTLSVSASDQFLSDSDTVNITINPINDPPINTVPGPQTLFNTDTLSFNSGDFQVSDVDNSSLEVTLTINDQASSQLSQGTLSVSPVSGLTISNNNSHTVTLNGSISSLNSGLGTLIYDPIDSFIGTDVLTMISSDGQLSDTESVTLTVTPPTVPFAASDFFQIEEDPLTDLTFNLSQLLNNDLAPDPVNNVDNTLSLTLINNMSPSTGSFSTTAGGSLTYNDSTNTFTYSPQANFFGLDTFTYTIESSPETGDGPSSGTVNIDVQPINDGPINSIPGGLSIDEDNSLSFTGSNTISIEDIDAGIDGVTVTLTVGNGTINVGGGASITNNGSGNVQLNGTVSQINNSLGGLTYTPQDDFFGSDQLQINTNDNGNVGGVRGNPTASNPLSDLDTVNITISPINDAPTLIVPGKQSFFTDFDNRFSSDPAPFSISDVDAGNEDVEVDLTIGDGILTISSTGGVTVSPNPGGQNGIRITGSVNNINNALSSGLDYNTSVAGNKSLNVTVNDLGNTGGGGAQSDSGTVDIEVLDFVPVDLIGKVFGDIDGDGDKDSNDPGIEGVEVRLSGTDFQGNSVDVNVKTNQRGEYIFQGLRPSGNQPYTITQIQPAFLQNGQQSRDSFTVSLDTLGNINANGSLSFTENSFAPGFIDPFDIFALSGQSPFNSGIVFGMRSQQEWDIFFGNGWNMDRYSNARFHPNQDGFSGTLTVFDSTIGADRTANVSTQAGTLSFRGSGNDRVYRVVGGSELLGSVPEAEGEGEAVSDSSSGDANSDARTFARAVDALFAGG